MDLFVGLVNRECDMIYLCRMGKYEVGSHYVPHPHVKEMSSTFHPSSPKFGATKYIL